MTAVATPALAVPREESAAGVVGRRLMVTWQDPETRTYHHVGWLTQYDDCSYGYAYLPSAQRLARFHPFVGFREFDRSYYSSHLFPFFAQRLLSPLRPDLPRLLSALALDHTDAVGPLEFLARSGGHRGGDTVELLPEPLVADDGSTCWLFLVHGVRHVLGAGEVIDRLRPGDGLEVVAEPDNPVNPEALLVTRDGQRLGWVPDPLLRHLSSIVNPELTVVRANAADLGHHLRLLVKVTGHVEDAK
jgi:hypothetical protein